MAVPGANPPAERGAPAGRERGAALLSAAGLLLNTLVWGVSFVLIKNALAGVSPLAFVTLRFAVAAALLGAVLCLRGGARARLRGSVTVALPAGAALWGGYLLQTLGLRATTPARAGFITGLSVVLVPPLARLIAREPLRRRAVAALVPALAGLALLTFRRAARADGGGSLGGDLLVLGCAGSFALQIALLARLVGAGRGANGRPDPLALTFWQMLLVALAAAVALPLDRGGGGTPSAWLAAAFLGAAGTAGAYLSQAFAQRHVDAAETALIYTAEPLFAALFAVWLAGERIDPPLVLGGACVVAAMLLGSIS